MGMPRTVEEGIASGKVVTLLMTQMEAMAILRWLDMAPDDPEMGQSVDLEYLRWVKERLSGVLAQTKP